MHFQYCSNWHFGRNDFFISTLLAFILCSSFVAGGNLAATNNKITATQQHHQRQLQQQQQQQQHIDEEQIQPQLQQQLHSQKQQQQRDQQQSHLQQQPQSPLLHQRTNQQSTNSHMQSINSQPTTITNNDYLVKDIDADVDGEVNEEINDPYQYLSELKMEPRLTNGNSLPWNPYATPNPPLPHMPTTMFPFNPYGAFGNGLSSSMITTPRLIPFFAYPHPIFLPLPMYFASTDILYPGFAGTGVNTPSNNDIDDAMSRAIGGGGGDRRAPGMGSPTARNSQIYFMRFATMPYGMLMPGFGFTTTPASIPELESSSYNPLSVSPILNIPLNFMANGRPTNIYQLSGGPNDYPGGAMHFNNVNPFGMRPPPALSPAFSFAQGVGGQRPTGSNVAGSFSPQGSYGLSMQTQQAHTQQQQQHDSKMTLLKRPYFFNGRPDEIYTLPNNFNSIYGNSAFY